MALSRALDTSRFDLEFACLRRWGPFVSEIAARQIPLTEYRIKSFYSISAIAQQMRLARHLSRHSVQIVHAYNFYGNVFAIPPARLAGTPVVIASIRDLGLYLTPLQKRVQRYVCRFADRILVNTEAVKNWLVGDGYDAGTITVIENGVDLDRFSQQVDCARIRRDLGVRPEAPLVVVVSRLNRQKGLEQFLEAAAIVSRRLPDVQFLLVGEASPFAPTYLDELKALARRLEIAPRVLFTGLRSDVPALLACADVAVMPSLNEALSNSLLESMAAGAAVVATRVGGTPDVLIHGQTGLLVPPADVGSLAASIAQFLGSPALAQRLGQAARRMIEERFSIQRMASRTEQLYRDLLARKLRAPVGQWLEQH
jgi:glycosyltransferase involved in cell wall biosynthesis